MASLVYHHEVSYKVQENDAVVDGLQHFLKVTDLGGPWDSDFGWV